MNDGNVEKIFNEQIPAFISLGLKNGAIDARLFKAVKDELREIMPYIGTKPPSQESLFYRI